MKKILLINLLLCLCCVAKADPVNRLMKNKNEQFYRFVEGITASYFQSNASSIATAERIVAQCSIANINGVNTIDSTRYIYNTSNHNGSAYNYIMLGYPTPSYGMDQGVENIYGYHTTPGVWADSILYYANVQAPFSLYEQNSFQYNSNNNISQFGYTRLQSPYFSGFSTAAYDNQNNITNVLGFIMLSSTPDSSARRYFSYSHGRLVSDSTYNNLSVGMSNNNFQLYGTNDYTYDNSGNLLTLNNFLFNYNTLVTTPNYRYVSTYTSDNRLQTSEYDIYSGGQWQMMEKDSMGYSSGITYPTYWISIDTSSTSPLTVHYNTNSAGLVDSIYSTVRIGGSSASLKTIFTYDSYNNPVTADLYSGVGTYFSTVPIQQLRYYYETYLISAVSTIASNNDIQVYPNPANDNISIKGLQAGNETMINIINLAGQLLIKQPACSTNTQTISLRSIPPGVYILNIADAMGTLHTQTVVKQ